MGVPVVTLAGATHVSRVGASILTSVELPELVAETPEQYLDIARSLAADAGKRRALRAGMRARMRSAPLMDGARFVRGLEDAYRAMLAEKFPGSATESSPAVGARTVAVPRNAAPPLRLHVGGRERKQGWKIVNIQPGPEVDYVGDCVDLGMFVDASVEEIYASHVLEHLGYQFDLTRALAEFHRVLKPGGTAKISVPDFETLCRLFLEPERTKDERFLLMRMAFGGQMDAHDFHYVGLTYEILNEYLARAGFASVKRVPEFGLFEDASTVRVAGTLISLSVIAYRA